MHTSLLCFRHYSNCLTSINSSSPQKSPVSVSWGCLTKCRRHLFLTVQDAGEAKIKVLVDLAPGESPLPGLQTAACLLRPHNAASELSSLLIRAVIVPWVLLPQTSPPNTITLGVRASTHEFGGGGGDGGGHSSVHRKPYEVNIIIPVETSPYQIQCLARDPRW